MSKFEVVEFANNRFFREAVQLRHWDDLAKVEGAQVPPLANYRSMIERVLQPAL